jgi:hypothetical protein
MHPSTACQTFVAAEKTCEQDAGTVDSEECPDGIKLCGKNLEYDECKAELADGGPNVRSLKRSLRCPDLDQFTTREYHRPRPVQAQRVSIFNMACLEAACQHVGSSRAVCDCAGNLPRTLCNVQCRRRCG